MNEENQEANEQESGHESREAFGISGTSPAALDQLASKKLGEYLEKTAEDFRKLFGARDYIETYYPPIDDQEKTLKAFAAVDSAFNSGSEVDVNDIVVENGISWEEAENLSIFSFQAQVLERLLMAYPRDQMKVLDVGGGPTVYQHIAMSLNAGDITHSEFLEQNRSELASWIEKKEGCYDWSHYFQLFKSLLVSRKTFNDTLDGLGQSQDLAAAENARKIRSIIQTDNTRRYEDHVRRAIGNRIVFCDAFKKGLGLAGSETFDFVDSNREGSVELLTSNFTIESATPERGQWEQGVKNIMELVKPGGYIVMTAIRNSSHYKVGGENLPATAVNEDDLKTIFLENGFTIEDLRVLVGSDKEEVGYDGMVFVFARKKEASQ